MIKSNILADSAVLIKLKPRLGPKARATGKPSSPFIFINDEKNKIVARLNIAK